MLVRWSFLPKDFRMTTLAPTLARWLGAADSEAPDHLWEPSDVPAIAVAHAAPTSTVTRTAMLTITGMPRALRPRIETVMVICIPSESELRVPGADPLTADWFTSWHRSHSRGPGSYLDCRQVLTGTDGELARLRDMVTRLARDHDFTADISLTD